LSEDTDFLAAKKAAERMNLYVRAFKGLPIDPDSVISNYTDVKDIKERSRFPNAPILFRQLYLRLVSSIVPRSVKSVEWANTEAKLWISYKGLSREELTKIKAAASHAAGLQNVVFGSGPQRQETHKRRWFRGKPKQSETELNE